MSSPKKRNRNRERIFDRAFDKCAKLKPGETVKLAPLEEEVLADALRRYREYLWSLPRRWFDGTIKPGRKVVGYGEGPLGTKTVVLEEKVEEEGSRGS